MQKKDLIKLLCSLCLVFSVMGFSSQFEPGVWYQQLSKPAWTPPGWVFAVVWPCLYFMMGMTLWFLWRAEKSRIRTQALWSFGSQLLLNCLWSPVFFGLQKPVFALGVIILLWVFVLSTLLYSLRVKKIAGLLLAPYLAWISFAVSLNYTIVRLMS